VPEDAVEEREEKKTVMTIWLLKLKNLAEAKDVPEDAVEEREEKKTVMTISHLQKNFSVI